MEDVLLNTRCGQHRRYYVKVPNDDMGRAKNRGGHWDPVAKLWWFSSMHCIYWPVIEYDHIRRAEACAGRCFKQGGRKWWYDCGCGACNLVPCPTCKTPHPYCKLDLQEGTCPACDDDEDDEDEDD